MTTLEHAEAARRIWIDRNAVRLAAVLAALPSLVWAVSGASFLTDDWAVWLLLDERSLVDGMWLLAFEQPARPLAAPYYAFIYLVVGDSPVIQGGLLAAINAGLVIAAWRLGRLVLPRQLLTPAILVFALLPNHSSTRFWFVVGTYALALTLAIIGVTCLVMGCPIPAALWLTASCLMYEGTIAFGVLGIVLWALQETRARLRPAAIALTPALGAAAFVFVISPKRTAPGGPEPFDHADVFLRAHLGSGVWGLRALAAAASLVALLFLLRATVAWLPSFRSDRYEYRWGLVGFVLMIGGAGPFLISSSIFVTRGIFDRNNLASSVGLAVLLAAIWVWLRPPLGSGAPVVGVVVLGWFGVQLLDDMADYRRAVTEGELVIDAFTSTFESAADAPTDLYVVPRQPGWDTGVSDFIYDGDLRGALQYRTGERWPAMTLISNVPCRSLGENGQAITVFDWTDGTVETVEAAAIAERCGGWFR